MIFRCAVDLRIHLAIDVPGGDNPIDSNNLLKIKEIFIWKVKNEGRPDHRVSGYFTACKRLFFRCSNTESLEIRLRSEKTGFVVNERHGGIRLRQGNLKLAAERNGEATCGPSS